VLVQYGFSRPTAPGHRHGFFGRTQFLPDLTLAAGDHAGQAVVRLEQLASTLNEGLLNPGREAVPPLAPPLEAHQGRDTRLRSRTTAAASLGVTAGDLPLQMLPGSAYRRPYERRRSDVLNLAGAARRQHPERSATKPHGHGGMIMPRRITGALACGLTMAAALGASLPAWGQGTTERVSLGPNGVQGNSVSTDPALSANGRFVVFSSDASNLVPDDTNGAYDVFVRRLASRR
jgi:hypothetical protein